jgi:hypothetical protein
MFKGQELQEERKNKKTFFLDFLTLEDGTDRLSRNVGTKLPFNAA